MFNVQTLRASENALNLIRKFESCRLKAYLCPSGIPTIGWGHTAGVKLGDTCTEEQAKAWLKEDIVNAENLVKKRVKVPVSQNHFDALVSFVFNIRQEKWNEQDCTLLRLLNKGDYEGAAGQFKRWVNGLNPKTGKMEPLSGLIRRRAKEEALFRA